MFAVAMEPDWKGGGGLFPKMGREGFCFSPSSSSIIIHHPSSFLSTIQKVATEQQPHNLEYPAVGWESAGEGCSTNLAMIPHPFFPPVHFSELHDWAEMEQPLLQLQEWRGASPVEFLLTTAL